MSKTMTLTILKDGQPAAGAKVIVADPFNKKFTLPASGKVSKSLADDFATVCNVHIKGDGFAMGTQLEIDISEKTDYIIEV